MGWRIVFMTGLCLSVACFCLGQTSDPSVQLTAEDSLALRVRRTTIWATFLPGSGQIINRQYWKAPVVWGGMGYAAWATLDNVKEMRASIDDLIAVTDDDPNTVAVLTDSNGNFFSAAQLEDRAYFYRRNRDLSILGFLIAHGLQILDANTGAILRNLDTSDALTFRSGTMWGVPVVQLTWKLNRHER